MRKTVILLSFIIIFVAIENLYSSGTSGCSFKWDDTITLTEDKVSALVPPIAINKLASSSLIVESEAR